MGHSVDVEQLLEAIGDAVMVSDPEGRIAYWNAGAERMFGFSRREALGASLDIIVPERLRERHWEGYRKTMATGQTRYGSDVLRVPALHRDGSTLSIAFTVALLHDDKGDVTGIAAVVREESRRFKEERELRSRVAELEARLKEMDA